MEILKNLWLGTTNQAAENKQWPEPDSYMGCIKIYLEYITCL